MLTPTQAHNNQRKGHIGLGQSTGSLKIAGGKWEGKRVVFEEQEEEAGKKAGGAQEAAQEGAFNRSEDQPGLSLQQQGEGSAATGEACRKRKSRKADKQGRVAPEVPVASAEDGKEGDAHLKKASKKRRRLGQEGGESAASEGSQVKEDARKTFKTAKALIAEVSFEKLYQSFCCL